MNNITNSISNSNQFLSYQELDRKFQEAQEVNSVVNELNNLRILDSEAKPLPMEIDHKRKIEGEGSSVDVRTQKISGENNILPKKYHAPSSPLVVYGPYPETQLAIYSKLQNRFLKTQRNFDAVVDYLRQKYDENPKFINLWVPLLSNDGNKEYRDSWYNYLRDRATSPLDPFLLFGRGLCEIEQNLYKDAINTINLRLNNFPQDDYFRTLFAYAYYFTQGETQENCLEMFQQVLINNPANDLAWYWKANVHYNQNKIKKALFCIDNALLLDPYFAPYYFFKGNCLQSKHKFEEAIINFNEAIKLDPLDAFSYEYRGECFANLKKYDEALRDISIFLKTDPENINALRLRSKLYLKKEKYAEAIADFTWLINNNNNNDRYRYKDLLNRGKAFFKLERYIDSYFDFENASRLISECLRNDKLKNDKLKRHRDMNFEIINKDPRLIEELNTRLAIQSNEAASMDQSK